MDKKEYIESKLEDEEVIKLKESYNQYIVIELVTILYTVIATIICIIIEFNEIELPFNLNIIAILGILLLVLIIIAHVLYYKNKNNLLKYSKDTILKDLDRFLINQKIENKDEISLLEEEYSEKLYSFEELALYNEHVILEDIEFVGKYTKKMEEIMIFFKEGMSLSDFFYHNANRKIKAHNYYLFKKSNMKANTFVKISPDSIEYLHKGIIKMLKRYRSNEDTDIKFQELDEEKAKKIQEIVKKYSSNVKIYINSRDLLFKISIFYPSNLNIKSIIDINYTSINTIKEILDIIG